MINKKGSLRNHTEAIIISVLLVIIFGVIIAGMNDLYGKDYEVAGLETEGIMNAAEDYQKGMEEKYRGGEISFLAQVGFTLTTLWDIIFSTMNLIWSFLSGGWIQTITTDYMRLPAIIGFVFRMLYFIAIGFIVLKMLRN